MACHRIRSDYSLSDLFQSLRSFSVFFDLSLFHRVVLKHFDNSCILRTKRMKLISQKIREIEESPKVLLVKGFLWKVFIERIRSTCIESNRIECTESHFHFRFRCWLRPFGKVSERGVWDVSIGGAYRRCWTMAEQTIRNAQFRRKSSTQVWDLLYILLLANSIEWAFDSKALRLSNWEFAQWESKRVPNVKAEWESTQWVFQWVCSMNAHSRWIPTKWFH